MSLLLDALKKSGDAESKSGSMAELQLEDVGHTPAKKAIAQEDVMHSAPKPNPQNSVSQNKVNATRAAGENLFAAKKAPAKKRKRLGLVPMAMIFGGIFAAVGGVYVYLEITPPNQRPFYKPPVAPVVVAPQPVSKPQPVAVAATLIPITSAPEVPAAVQSTEKPAETSVSSKPATSAVTPKKLAPRSRQATKTNSSGRALDIQHKQQTDSIDSVLNAAYQSYQSGDLATAWQRYREALAKDPKNRDALLGLAVISQQQGQDDSALHYYRQVLALDPRDPIAQAGLASFGSGDAASKESRLKQLITQQPDSAALHFALGNQYVDQSRWSDAQQAFFNALAIEPSNALFAFNLAISLDHLGQRKPAAQYYQQALQYDKSGNAGFNREQAQKRLNELTATTR